MSEAENKAFVRRVTDELFNKRSVDAVSDFFAPELIPHILPPGMSCDRDGFKQLVAALVGAFPDFHVTIDDMVAEGDKVVGRATATGTHKGEFFGIAPTGKHATWTEIFLWRISGDKVAEIWGEVDQLGLMQQLGVVAPPGKGGE